MNFAQPEILILLMAAIIMLSGPTIRHRFGLRALTFERAGDAVIGVCIVASFLATFLFLGR